MYKKYNAFFSVFSIPDRYYSSLALICKQHLIFCTPQTVHNITLCNSSHLPLELYSKCSNVPTGTKYVYLTLLCSAVFTAVLRIQVFCDVTLLIPADTAPSS